ncbi:GTPase domain-containing protein [Herbidospora sp. RD11066]
MNRLKEKTFRIAPLGARRTGKTTLINSWRGTWVEDPDHTHAPRIYEKTKITTNGLSLTFLGLGDLSGEEKAWPQWENRVSESRYVLYLVDARLLAGFPMPAERSWHRVEDDAGQIGKWLSDREAYLCVLVVTHTDEDPRSAELDEADYAQTIADQLDPILLRLGGDARVRIVSGSLKDQESADLLTSKIMEHIVSHEGGL